MTPLEVELAARNVQARRSAGAAYLSLSKRYSRSKDSACTALRYSAMRAGLAPAWKRAELGMIAVALRLARQNRLGEQAFSPQGDEAVESRYFG